jgi:hypothetical protein
MGTTPYTRIIAPLPPLSYSCYMFANICFQWGGKWTQVIRTAEKHRIPSPLLFHVGRIFAEVLKINPSFFSLIKIPLFLKKSHLYSVTWYSYGVESGAGTSRLSERSASLSGGRGGVRAGTTTAPNCSL